MLHDPLRYLARQLTLSHPCLHMSSTETRCGLGATGCFVHAMWSIRGRPTSYFGSQYLLPRLPRAWLMPHFLRMIPHCHDKPARLFAGPMHRCALSSFSPSRRPCHPPHLAVPLRDHGGPDLRWRLIPLKCWHVTVCARPYMHMPLSGQAGQACMFVIVTPSHVVGGSWCTLHVYLIGPEPSAGAITCAPCSADVGGRYMQAVHSRAHTSSSIRAISPRDRNGTGVDFESRDRAQLPTCLV